MLFILFYTIGQHSEWVCMYECKFVLKERDGNQSDPPSLHN